MNAFALPFDRTSLYRLLINVAYVGQIRHKDELHASEHAAIIDPKVFAEVQAHLHRNGRTGGAVVRNQSGAILKGLLRCQHCDCAMTPTYTTKGSKRYRYYVCSSAQKNGRSTCRGRTVPAGPIDEFVVGRIRTIGRDPDLVRETITAVQAQSEANSESLTAERRLIEKDQRKAEAEVRGLSSKLAGDTTGLALQRLAEVQTQMTARQARLDQVRAAEAALAKQRISDESIVRALSEFDGVWEELTPKEQAKLVSLLIERVDYDGADSSIEIHFHATGLETLARTTTQDAS